MLQELKNYCVDSIADMRGRRSSTTSTINGVRMDTRCSCAFKELEKPQLRYDYEQKNVNKYDRGCNHSVPSNLLRLNP